MDRVINTELLNDKIKNSGYKKEFLAEQLGINSASLSRKINNKVQFRSLEIKELCKILSICSEEERDAIFFAK